MHGLSPTPSAKFEISMKTAASACPLTSRRVAAASLCLAAAAIGGCSKQEIARPPVGFEPNYVYARVIQSREDIELENEDFIRDVNRFTEQWFGTPDEPRIPPPLQEDEDLADLITLENLQMAAGPAPADTTTPGDRGLYQQLCVSCHGETGQGRGVVAASQNPYPRDFRKGLFKYKFTSRNSKPTREDLRHTLRNGLPGSQMPKFDHLSDKQIEALVDYVIYLSMRGEFERQLIGELMYDYEPGMRVLVEPKKEAKPAATEAAATEGEEEPEPSEAEELYEEQLEIAADELADIATSWLDAEDDVIEPEEPENIVVAGRSDEPVDEAELAASVERGRKLFVNAVAACSKCHGESAKGDGPQLPDYDDWTKEWTQQINVNPADRSETLPFLVDGALPPQPIRPRNLVEGLFRGGRHPDEVYHRIVEGIAGTPMPAAARSSGEGSVGLTENDIWDIVNYVLSLKADEPAPGPTQEQTASTAG